MILSRSIWKYVRVITVSCAYIFLIFFLLTSMFISNEEKGIVNKQSGDMVQAEKVVFCKLPLFSSYKQETSLKTKRNLPASPLHSFICIIRRDWRRRYLRWKEKWRQKHFGSRSNNFYVLFDAHCRIMYENFWGKFYNFYVINSSAFHRVSWIVEHKKIDVQNYSITNWLNLSSEGLDGTPTRCAWYLIVPY